MEEGAGIAAAWVMKGFSPDALEKGEGSVGQGQMENAMSFAGYRLCPLGHFSVAAAM